MPRTCLFREWVPSCNPQVIKISSEVIWRRSNLIKHFDISRHSWRMFIISRHKEHESSNISTVFNVHIIALSVFCLFNEVICSVFRNGRPWITEWRYDWQIQSCSWQVMQQLMNTEEAWFLHQVYTLTRQIQRTTHYPVALANKPVVNNESDDWLHIWKQYIQYDVFYHVQFFSLWISI